MAPTTGAPGAARYVPDHADLDALRAAVDGCRGCTLYRDTTQGVGGAGPADATVVLVGEQPGDAEDRQGAPFVGPAGRVLRRAVDEAGLPADRTYRTNAVKHFGHTLRGERRIHRTPTRTEVAACRPWLVAEFGRLRPTLVVALGATAGRALFGPDFRVTRDRGTLLPWPRSAEHPADFPDTGARALATIHPSAVLRADDRETAYAGLVADLRTAAAAL
ncbi:uracil-DNA glycosylase [Pilimelia anulata]|uniref:Type-4 uracil-DNA glycosylase n=1 Tax=Pilimelia anulata TaxID=53371 RepID=A0A8J3F7J6_9ACTN|nr:UdgX family uracil-DNA binding protein [Pilimelia anulata]GGJ77399.1 uracil-DNA glycosylase [Pilimelia anulata]